MLSGFELYSRWVPLNKFYEMQPEQCLKQRDLALQVTFSLSLPSCLLVIPRCYTQLRLEKVSVVWTSALVLYPHPEGYRYSQAFHAGGLPLDGVALFTAGLTIKGLHFHQSH